MNYIRVSGENRSEFASVLPEIFTDENRVSLVAYEDDGTVCGAVSLSYAGYQYNVDWLYVVPERRRSKVGTGLLKEVQYMVASIGICPIIARFDASKDNGLYEFFMDVSNPDMLVDVEYAFDRYNVSAEDFINSEVLKKKGEMDYVPVYLFDMDEEQREKAFDKAMEHLVLLDTEGFEESCVKELCFAVENNGEISALMIVQKEVEGELHLSYLYSEDGKSLMSMLVPAAREVRKNYKGYSISFDAVTDEAELLAKKFFPKAERGLIYEAEL